MCISYDAVACQVWLDPIAVGPSGGQPLCGDHAQRLSAPRGWVVLDRRTSQATLMTPPSSPIADSRGAGAIPRRRLPRAWGQFDAPRLEFLADGEVDTAPAAPEPVILDPVPLVPLVDEMVMVTAAVPVISEPAVPESAVPAPAVLEPAVLESAVEPVLESTQETPAAPLKKPKGRLLSRAFESTGDQRSALTHTLGDGTSDS